MKELLRDNFVLFSFVFLTFFVYGIHDGNDNVCVGLCNRFFGI